MGDITRTYELVKSLPPFPHRIMASHSDPWPKVYRQWDTLGRLLLWVNRGAIHDLPTRRNRPAVLYDNFLTIEDITAIPVEFV